MPREGSGSLSMRLHGGSLIECCARWKVVCVWRVVDGVRIEGGDCCVVGCLFAFEGSVHVEGDVWVEGKVQVESGVQMVYVV